ncbi:MAG: hypothetical protein ACE5LH_06750, partial [Fidelibacterota bacterium]
LGSVNLERFVDANGDFREEAFRECVAIATRFMDDVVDYNMDRHALPVQKENAMNDRRVGLGLLGLGDMFVRMKIPYDTDDALRVTDRICSIMRDTAYETSVDLARERGPFPNFQWEGYSRSKFVQNLPPSIRERIRKHGIRNATLITVPPTGTGAIVAQVTSGIEPIFQVSYARRVKLNEGYGNRFKEYKVYHPIVKKLFGTDKDLPGYVVTAHNIDPYFRVKMQGAIQKYVDSSISSTVNLPSDVSPETVADIYMTAYKAGLKGITVYREGAREGILVSDSQRESAVVDPRESSGEVNTAPSPARNEGRERKPRIRPGETYGVTKRVRTGEGSLYITINRDDRGLCEVFTTIGKAGGNAAAQSEAISRLISLALRSGINPREVVKQLKGISGPYPTWENGQLILSTPDAIGKALEEYLDRENDEEGKPQTSKPSGGTRFTLADEPDSQSRSEQANPKTLSTCPDCGSTMIHDNGCVTCPNCGYSTCD